MNPINSIKEFYSIVEENDKVIIYFYTKWCPDCYMIKPFIPRLESDFNDYQFFSFDRDISIDLAKHLEIYGIPSFIIFQDGDELSRLVNKARKSYIEVKNFIETAIK